jgi:hypothetical protein
MGCSACGKPKQTSNVKITSTFSPKVNNPVKMTDVLMSFSVEKKPNNDISGKNSKDSQ